MKLIATIVILLANFPPIVSAQTHTQQKSPAAATPASLPDQLGLTCAQILKMTSSEWVAYFREKTNVAAGENPDGILRATRAYGRCYDARTDRLAAALAKKGTGPLMGARGNFRDFEAALKAFAAAALNSTDPPADEVKTAYATLYLKQFRYDFYRSYEQKTVPALPPTPEELEGYGRAKNQFGEKLDDLSTEKMRAVHAAFSRIFEGPVSDAAKSAVYRYGIFLLEIPSAKPFSPPPF
ncbi:MAG: hypothetical protein WBP79_10385 [Candidatus Acidiferrales bacterium]